VRKRQFYSVILCDSKIALFDTNVYFSGSRRYTNYGWEN